MQFLKDIGYQPPVKSCRIILGSIAKIFAGELVEEARDIMKAKGESGPIHPRHLVGTVRPVCQQLALRRTCPTRGFHAPMNIARPVPQR